MSFWKVCVSPNMHFEMQEIEYFTLKTVFFYPDKMYFVEIMLRNLYNLLKERCIRVIIIEKEKYTYLKSK